MHIKRPHALRNPPVNGDVWPDGSGDGGGDDASRRRAKAHAATGEVRRDQVRLEADIQQALVARLTRLKGELLGVLRGQPAEFRRWHTQQLLTEVDRLLAEAQADLGQMAGRAYRRANDLGTTGPRQAIRGASFLVTVPPAVNEDLVRHAFDTTLDLLSEPMAKLRGDIRGGVRRLALTGESFAVEWQRLTARLEAEGFDQMEYRSERIIRTELGRVFNGASYEQMLSLGARFPFLRKIWMRTNDGRTRVTHIDAGARYRRGQGIPVSERFSVGGVLLRFPLDAAAEPAGKLAAKETILCRCNAATDFDVAAMREHGAQRVTISMSR